MSRVLLKTGNEMDREHTLMQPSILDTMGVEHTKFGKGRLVFEDYNNGDSKTTELQFPFIDPEAGYHMDYKESSLIINDSFDKLLDEYKSVVYENYPHLNNTIATPEPKVQEVAKSAPSVSFDTNEFEDEKPEAVSFDIFGDDDTQEDEFGEIDEMYTKGVDQFKELQKKFGDS